METHVICIYCPMGCCLTVEKEGNNFLSVTGQACKRGEEYARQETVMPMRILTGLLKVQGCRRPISVKTDKPIPRDLLLECGRELKQFQAVPPIAMGDIIIKNVLNTGSNVIATQDLAAESPEI
jgi:CxxC motif-containing protein